MSDFLEFSVMNEMIKKAKSEDYECGRYGIKYESAGKYLEGLTAKQLWGFFMYCYNTGNGFFLDCIVAYVKSRLQKNPDEPGFDNFAPLLEFFEKATFPLCDIDYSNFLYARSAGFD